MSVQLTEHGPPAINAVLTRTRRWAVGAAAMPLLFGVLGGARPALSPDSGLAGCTALSGTHPVAATGWPAIGTYFVDSRWPDLRNAGTAYVALATALLHARNTDGYESVWFYERLSAACAKHGRALRI